MNQRGMGLDHYGSRQHQPDQWWLIIDWTFRRKTSIKCNWKCRLQNSDYFVPAYVKKSNKVTCLISCETKMIMMIS